MTIHDLVQKALSANRESKNIEFKESFDPDSTGDCCELAKDFVALANSGGGILVIGLDSFGVVAGSDLSKLFKLDPADITNKLSKYVGGRELSFTIEVIEKETTALFAFLVDATPLPFLFEKPGTYPAPETKSGQKTAFGQGTVFFRHGAKSEPGTNLDLEKSLERRLASIRNSWMSGVKKVVKAPLGSQVQVVQAKLNTEFVDQLSSVRAVSDQTAQPINITRNPSIATTGIFLHETVSEDLVREVNNVVDVNRFLFPGRDRFLMGADVYYRIYAERKGVVQAAPELDKLYLRGLADYFPFLYWCTLLPDETVAIRLAQLVLSPRGKEAFSLPRILPIFGESFYQWILLKFHKRWKGISQPPSIYWKVQKVGDNLGKVDPRLIASGMGPSSAVSLPGDRDRLLSEVLDDQTYLEEVISQACLKVVDGDKGWVSTSRDFDYLANGKQLVERNESIGSKIQEIVGDRLPDIDSADEKSDDL